MGFPLCHEMNGLSESPQYTNFCSSHRLSSVATEKGESAQPKAGLEVVRKSKWDLGIHVWPDSLHKTELLPVCVCVTQNTLSSSEKSGLGTVREYQTGRKRYDI